MIRLVDVVRSTWPTYGGPPTIDETLGVVLAGLALLAALWLALGSALALLTRLPGALGRLAAQAADAVTPVVLRKLAAVLLGTSLGTVALPPTMASGSGSSWASMSASRQDVPDPGFAATDPTHQPPFRPTFPDSGSSATPLPPLPTFPTTGAETSKTTMTPTTQTAHTTETARAVPRARWLPPRPPKVHDAQSTGLLTPAPRTQSASVQTVTVRRGDTLWSIAARHLGPAATDVEVARSWPLWHAANRDLIGPDPHLILPGQQLVPPIEGLP